MFGSCTFQAPLLGLKAARNTVRARKVGGAQTEENGKVGRRAGGAQVPVCVVEFLTAMCINTPFIRALGHDEKPSALAI